MKRIVLPKEKNMCFCAAKEISWDWNLTSKILEFLLSSTSRISHLFEKVWSWGLPIPLFPSLQFSLNPGMAVLSFTGCIFLVHPVILAASMVLGVWRYPVSICGMKEKNRRKTSLIYRGGNLEIPIKIFPFQLKLQFKKQITQIIYLETFGIRRFCVLVVLQHHYLKTIMRPKELESGNKILYLADNPSHVQSCPQRSIFSHSVQFSFRW